MLAKRQGKGRTNLLAGPQPRTWVFSQVRSRRTRDLRDFASEVPKIPQRTGVDQPPCPCGEEGESSRDRAYHNQRS
jgi:hypothetical protein